MQTPTAHAAHAAAQPSATAAQYTSVELALYRAALGTVNVDHYLAAFERLDRVGRVLPGWNLAAALCPPGWAVFRRLWRVALLYVLALALLGLLSWLLEQLALPRPMVAGTLLAVLLMVHGGLGLYGDALVHGQVRRRIHRAVAAAPTMREAMAQVQHQASGFGALRWPLALGAGAVLIGALWWWLPGGSVVAPAAVPEPVVGREAAAPVAPVDLPTVGEKPDAPVTAHRPTEVMPQQPDLLASVPAEQVQAAEPGLPEAVAAAVDEPAKPPAPALAPPPRQAAQQFGRPIDRPAPDKPAKRQLFIDVGLFADPANARRTHERLRQAGLPSSVRPLVRSDGRRLERVRVGPFTSAAQANAAVAQVRLLGLDAVAAAQ